MQFDHRVDSTGALQGGIKRAVIHQKVVAGLPLEKLGDALCVIGAKVQAAQDRDFQGSLQEFEAFGLVVY